MANEKKRVEVTCPCCQATLIVEPVSGLVLSSKERRTEYSFEAALEREKVRKSKADELFDQAFQNERRRHDSLEEKFRQALDSQDELEEPIRPMDLD